MAGTKRPTKKQIKKAISEGRSPFTGKKNIAKKRTTFADRRGQEQEFNMRKEKRKR